MTPVIGHMTDALAESGYARGGDAALAVALQGSSQDPSPEPTHGLPTEPNSLPTRSACPVAAAVRQ